MTRTTCEIIGINEVMKYDKYQCQSPNKMPVCDLNLLTKKELRLTEIYLTKRKRNKHSKDCGETNILHV